MSGPLRIGTRGSALALAQTRMTADALAAASGRDVQIIPITTHGDTSRASLASLGGTGVFATALRDALVDGRCDLVVHSFKDLPTAPAPGLAIGAVPRREDARDALVSRGGVPLADLPVGARVGTGSPRRAAQLRACRPDFEVVDIRGNVDSRLARVSTDGPDGLDAVLLAAAGLSRLGRIDAVTQLLELDEWPTAPAQGALAIEVREQDAEAGELAEALRRIDDEQSRLAAHAERGVLAGLAAGCSAPIGATAAVADGALTLRAGVYALDGTRSVTATHTVRIVERDEADAAAAAATAVVAALLAQGAAQLAPLGGDTGGDMRGDTGAGMGADIRGDIYGGIR